MISRSGDRVPAGVSGEAGRGTVGTDAPTTPSGFTEAMISPVMWMVAAGYTIVGALLTWLAISLAPWGLFILIPALGSFSAAAIMGALAYGVSRLGEDPA